ncbi:NYN domain-containing protein [bacterium]|nr:NYN domain-containing protein [bacterium]
MDLFIPSTTTYKDLKIMIFVDGENLAIRYRHALNKKHLSIPTHVNYEKDIFVWSHYFNMEKYNCEIIRKYYYTSVQGDGDKIEMIEQKLKHFGIEAPRVFKKDKEKGSKQVDIALATEMLTHAHRKNYDVAILVSGDEDYIPLVEAVKDEGCRVFQWFIEDGNNIKLSKSVDYYFDIGTFLFNHDLSLLIEKLRGLV